MTEQFQEGFKQAQAEFEKRITERVKAQTLATLEAIEKKKEQKAKVEEELRILKLDLDDLKAGNLDKIKERIEKSDVAKNVTHINPWELLHPYNMNIGLQPHWTMHELIQCVTDGSLGTYTTSSGRNYYISI